jgi:hypothetical protein
MTFLLWWSVASVTVSIFVGAFLAHARREPETLHLDLRPGEPASPMDGPTGASEANVVT